mmetsp:Transcript_46133/g.84712  ORF Transcript_46133/g.84712 Transcript_46133/m.84712 type:complete len:200 (+) Transcript_46133:129-728(+)
MDRSWGDRALPFLAVGRVKDGVTLAYYTTTDTGEHREQTKGVFKKLLQAASAKLSKGQRTRLAWNEGSVCCLMDQQGVLLYCVVTSHLTYPERLAYQLLYDLVVAVQQVDGVETAAENAFNEVLSSRMRELVTQYEDPKNFPQLQMNMDRVNVVNTASDAPHQQQANALMMVRARKQKLIAGAAGIFVLLLLIIVFSRK